MMDRIDLLVGEFRSATAGLGFLVRVVPSGRGVIMEMASNGRSFSIQSDGGEAIVSVVESGKRRLDFEWDTQEQIELIREIISVGKHYLSGEGRFRTGRWNFFGRRRQILTIDVDGQVYEFD